MNKNKLLVLSIIIFTFLLGLTSCKKEDSSELKLYSFSFENNNTCFVTGLKSEEENLDLVIPSKIYKNNIEYKVTGINELSFSGKTNINTVIIPDSITVIESQAFARCTGLKKVKLSNSLTSIDEYAFDGCTSLINIELPESLTNLGFGAFRKCSQLTSINIPSKITEIKNETFKGDSKLNYLRANVLTHIYSNAFNSCSSLKQIYVESDLSNTVIDDNNAYFSAASVSVGTTYEDSDILNENYFVFDFTSNTCAYAGKKSFFEMKKVSIPDTVDFYGKTYKVNQIYDYALYNEDIEKIELSDNIIKINRYAFSNSNLKSINFKNVVQIEMYAFSNCNVLKTVEFSESTTTIGDYAFLNCSSLKNVELPVNLTQINQGLFSGCTSLLNITIFDNVKTIQAYVFADCTNLSTINCTFSKETYDTISIDSTTKEEIKNVSYIFDYQINTTTD